MIISDLNHLEVVEGASIVGGSYKKFSGFAINNNKKEKIDINIDVNSNQKYVQKVNLEGNAAYGESENYAEGDYTDTKGFVVNEAVAGKYSNTSVSGLAVAQNY